MRPAFPVVFGICFDAEALWLQKKPADQYRPILLSQGTFAATEGLVKLLDLLDSHDITATFFVPGVTADRYPDQVKLINNRGHEIGGHGYGHLSVIDLDPAAEEEQLVKGNDAIKAIIGRRPTTWRSPSWEFSRHTLGFLEKHGIKCSTNFQDRHSPYRHIAGSRHTSVVELPVHWHLADAPYFVYGGLPGRIIAPSEVPFQIWKDEFDALYGSWPGSFFHLTLHVQLIGHPGRLAMLDKLIRHMKRRRKTRFYTSADLAASVT